jgi:hypothetical protein
MVYDLELSRRQCIIKSSRATSRVKWLKYENTDVSRSISVLVLRVLKWLKLSTVSYIYLLRPRVHGWRFYVKPGLVPCDEYATQSEILAKQGEFVTPPTSPHWLARGHEHGAWAGIYMTRLGVSTTSEPWGRGLRWTSKRQCFHILTTWRGW